MMTVYHTSSVRIELPNTLHSRKLLDLGKGFYLTTIREQAEKYAERFLRRNEMVWLSIYNLSEDWSSWKVKRFDTYDEEWLDFVMGCRQGEELGDYDMVIGGIANDKVFETLDLYFGNLIDKEQALLRLSYEKPNIQYCIRTDAMIQECLTFVEAIGL